MKTLSRVHVFSWLAIALMMVYMQNPAFSQKAREGIVDPHLEGYIRSPYTKPPRLINLAGLELGGIITCPYTGKPIRIPASILKGQKQNLVETSVKDSDPAQEKMVEADLDRATSPQEPKADLAKKESGSAEPTPSPQPQEPKKNYEAEVNLSPDAESSEPKPEPATPASPETKKEGSEMESPALQKAPSASDEGSPLSSEKAEQIDFPTAEPIPGHPGYVISPHVKDKKRYLDVRSVPPGSLVKCPITGKPFRVPKPESPSPSDSPKN